MDRARESFRGVYQCVALVAPSSGATIFWNDGMEPGSVIGNGAWLNGTLIPQGAYAFDSNIKFSGTHSIRQNFPTDCMASAASGSQCGGAIGRNFTPSDEVYRRFYFRMSGDTNRGATIGSPGGSFQIYQSAFTKMIEGESTHSPGASNYARHWWSMGCCGSKNFLLGAEGVPVPTSAMNFHSSISLQDNRWYCIEVRTKMNTIVDGVGQPDGIAEAWVDNVKVLTVTNIPWRNSGTDSNAKWQEFGTVRQGGIGNIWYDAWAAGNTRIWCLGSTPPPPPDTTPPAGPRNLRTQ